MKGREALEGLARSLPGGPAQVLLNEVIDNPYPAAFAAVQLAASMGANAEWSSAPDYLDWFADILHHSGFSAVGSDEHLGKYRAVADCLNIDHDGEGEE